MPGMTLNIPKDSDQHKRFVEELSSRIQLAERGQSDRHEKWDQADKTMNAYVPETSDDAARRAKRDSDGFQTFTTIKIPYTYALVMAAHTYWTSVFLGRSPIHQFEGRHGHTEQGVQALEATIAYQTRIGRAIPTYFLWLYDTAKYGVGILGAYWDEKIHTYSVMTKDETGRPVYVTNQVAGYKGNCCYNVSPRDFLPDPRVPIGRFQEGEFCAVYRAMSWNELIQRKARGYYVNTEHIKKTPTRRRALNTDGFLTQPLQLQDIGSRDSKHPAWVGIYEVYISLLPKEWKLGEMEMPEKWVFTITEDLETIIGAQPLGAIHDQYPFDVLEAEPEGYALYNRGIPEVVEPLQNTMDWLFNSHFFNVRANANGRFVYDPSRLDASEMESGEPGWMIALKPEAWGQVTDINQVFKQIQISDTTANHMNDVERVFQIGERATGISEQVLGALSGGRRTAAEVRTTAGFSVNRLKSGAELMSATGFSSHALKLVQNTQQYLDEEMNLQVVGDLIQFGGKKYVKVSPETIAGAWDFVPVDGALPIDRFAQVTLWKDLIGNVTRMPQIMQGYDWASIFAWVAGLAGLKNLNQFRIQVVPDQQINRDAAAGNIVPIRPPGGVAGGNANMGPTTPVPTVSP